MCGTTHPCCRCLRVRRKKMAHARACQDHVDYFVLPSPYCFNSVTILFLPAFVLSLCSATCHMLLPLDYVVGNTSSGGRNGALNAVEMCFRKPQRRARAKELQEGKKGGKTVRLASPTAQGRDKWVFPVFTSILQGLRGLAWIDDPKNTNPESDWAREKNLVGGIEKEKERTTDGHEGGKESKKNTTKKERKALSPALREGTPPLDIARPSNCCLGCCSRKPIAELWYITKSPCCNPIFNRCVLRSMWA